MPAGEWLPGSDFTDHVHQHIADYLAFAERLVDQPADAEDLVQEALIRVAAKWPQLREQQKAPAYVNRTIANLNVSRWRRLRREVLRQAPEIAGPPAISNEVGDVMRSALMSLGKRQRTVVILRYYLDMADDDIADALGCSVSTVRSQASRALLTMKGQLMTAKATGRCEGLVNYE
jgi:RNA polymerase sigma-70 factor (sigma-E family)